MTWKGLEPFAVPLPGDLLFGTIFLTEETRRDCCLHGLQIVNSDIFPVRARFHEGGKGWYSYQLNGIHYSGTMAVEEDTKLALSDELSGAPVGLFRKLPDERSQWVVGGSILAQSARQTLIEGEITTIVPWTEGSSEFRPRNQKKPLRCPVAGRIVRHQLDFHPGGGVVRGLLYVHIASWFIITFLVLAAIPFTDTEGGAPLFAYIVFIPILLAHQCIEQGILRRYARRCDVEDFPKFCSKNLFDSRFMLMLFSALDVSDIFTDTLFCVMAMKSSNDVTGGWADSWEEATGSTWLGQTLRWLGFGPFAVLLYVFTVIVPQCLHGLWTACWLQRSTLDEDKSGERIEEDVLFVQDAAANASCLVIEKTLRMYVQKHFQVEIIALRYKPEDYDTTLHVRILRRVLAENLFQFWNQSSFLGLTITSVSDGALAQTLGSLIVGLAVALYKTKTMGITATQVLLCPFTVLRWASAEFANVRFTNEHTEFVWASTHPYCPVVVKLVDEHKAKDYFLSQNEKFSVVETPEGYEKHYYATFKVFLRARRREVAALAIILFCAVIAVRLACILACWGPFNFTTGCVHASGKTAMWLTKGGEIFALTIEGLLITGLVFIVVLVLIFACTRFRAMRSQTTTHNHEYIARYSSMGPGVTFGQAQSQSQVYPYSQLPRSSTAFGYSVPTSSESTPTEQTGLLH